MKKMTAVLMTIAFVFAFVIALRGNGAAKTKESSDGTMYNGITYFDPGAAPSYGNAIEVERGDAGSAATMFNGVTYFDLGLSKTGARGSGAGGPSAKAAGAWQQNGITIF
jgi:hypothetical protein